MYRIFTKSFVVAENVSDFEVAKAIAKAMDSECGTEYVYIVRTDARGCKGDVVMWKVWCGSEVRAIGTVE